MLITLIGPDRFLVGQALHGYLDKYTSHTDGMEGFNLSRMDGTKITPDELARAVQSIGFFGETRVVVVEGLLARFGSKAAEDDESTGSDASKADAAPKGRSKADLGMTDSFASVLASVPDSTVLVLVERGSVAKNSSLRRAAERHGKLEEYLPPKGVALERWVSDRCKQLGVRITPGAQSALATSLPELQTLATELDKLSLYVGQGGTIDERVLRDMSYASKQDDVFEMTSAAARRDTRGALMQLQRLVDGGTSPEGILPVLAWQVRTLIQVRDMLDRKVPEHRMAESSGLSDFVLRKSIGQARQFTMKKLLEIHHALLELDHAVKTGRADAEMSLDALVVEMCQ